MLKDKNFITIKKSIKVRKKEKVAYAQRDLSTCSISDKTCLKQPRTSWTETENSYHQRV